MEWLNLLDRLELLDWPEVIIIAVIVYGIVRQGNSSTNKILEGFDKRLDDFKKDLNYMKQESPSKIEDPNGLAIKSFFLKKLLTSHLISALNSF